MIGKIQIFVEIVQKNPVITTKIKELMRFQKRTSSIWKIFCLLVLVMIVGQGCTARIHSTTLPRSFPPAPALLGYTIQTGAFSLVDNAIRMTDSLNKRGYEAFYFVHESGLFKVRMGNFPNRKKADLRAKRLLDKNVITDYFIVPPREYPSAGSRAWNEQSFRERLVATARNFISYPYTWGGESPEEGFDCSGLALAVYHINGFSLPRTSREQYRSGKLIQKSQLQIGDLVFFKTVARRNVSHVGIYAGNDFFIHAPGSNKTIRMDSLSNRFYKDRYVGARSYF